MEELRAKFINAIAEAADEAALEDVRIAAVGQKGEVALKMRELGKMSPENARLPDRHSMPSRMRSIPRSPHVKPPLPMPRSKNGCAANG